MLISQNEVEGKSEWQNLDRVKLSPSRLQETPTTKSNQIQSGMIDEYGKFLHTIYSEYFKQIEIFSTLQKSNTEIFYNSFRTTYNFFNLSFDVNNKLIFGFLKK